MSLPKRAIFGLIVNLAIFFPMVYAQDASLAKKINEAIDKGVVFLKDYSEAGNKGNKRPGSWALRGWALLEAGVAPNDPVIKDLVDYVRQSVPVMDRVYDLSLSLIFLDKMGDPADDLLIESIAVRLLARQSDKGGWTYATDIPNQTEQARLTALLLEMEKMRSEGLAIKIKPRTPLEIEQDISKQAATIVRTNTDFGGDNSNTQFAMMAVWVARRHGVRVDPSLEMVEKRFQVSQVKTGAWGYQFPAGNPPEDDNHYSHPAMTCAGLLGLALGQGVKANPKNLMEDVQVQLGLEVVGKALTGPPAPKLPNLSYFLFSMERMAVVYNLKKIAGEDWYLWGAQKLVDQQAPDGSWSCGFERDAADTCFALLFLKRANVARDLTQLLEGPLRKSSSHVERKSNNTKIPDNLFDPPKLVPKK
jgi:hypothetical protein